MLLLDEPTAGMSPRETAAMVDLLADLPSGLALLVIEHDMDVLFRLAERITVLDYGRVLIEGTPSKCAAPRRCGAAISAPRAGERGVLRVEAIDTHYGASHTLQRVSLDVPRGSVVALLGRNGAGKSTTLKSIMGVVPVTRGVVRFAGEEIHRLPRHQIARRGIAYVPEERGIFASLTVDEHLTLSRRRGSGARRFPPEKLYATFPALAERRRHRGNELSGGEQQMLAIARALGQEPRLLILDEPTEGLAPVIVERIAAVIRTLREAGMTMLLVEQNYPFAMSLAERVYVLGKGRIRWYGDTVRVGRQPVGHAHLARRVTGWPSASGTAHRPRWPATRRSRALGSACDGVLPAPATRCRVPRCGCRAPRRSPGWWV